MWIFLSWFPSDSYVAVPAAYSSVGHHLITLQSICSFSHILQGVFQKSGMVSEMITCPPIPWISNVWMSKYQESKATAWIQFLRDTMVSTLLRNPTNNPALQRGKLSWNSSFLGHQSQLIINHIAWNLSPICKCLQCRHVPLSSSCFL